MTHCLIRVVALTGILLGAACACGQERPADRPNVLVILADDMGWSDIGAFGSEISTPQIDKLAADGVKFTQFYNAARCCPSRASLLTGLYPHQAGVGHMLWPTGYPGYMTRLSRNAVTLAEVLRDAGYGTYMTGKWHLAERVADPAKPVGWPLDRGFQKFYGTLAGYGSFYDPASLCRDNTYITPQNDPEYKTDAFYYTDAISDNAVKYLQAHRTASADKPFFMYVAYTAAHWPLQAPDEAIAPYKGKYDAGYDAVRQQRIAKLKELGLMPPVTTPAPTTGDWDAVQDKRNEARRMEAFAGMVTRMDDGIGRIVGQLRASGELDNTVILYLHDNGGCDEEFFQNNVRPPANVHAMAPDELQDRTLPPMQTRDGRIVRTGKGVMAGPETSFLGYGPAWANVSNTPLRLVKKNAHEGGISTPLIVHWPAGTRRAGGTGNVVSTPSHLIDVMPTVIEIAAAKYPRERGGQAIPPVEGESLVPLVAGSGDFHRDQPLFWEHEGHRAVRDGQWKLVAEENEPWELYDMRVDRGEMNDLAARHPDRVQQMAAAWQAYAERCAVQPYGAHRLRKRGPEPEGAPARLAGLKSGAVYKRQGSPVLSDAGIHITARIGRMAPEGVIVAQGAEAHGYALYLQGGRAHFVARRAGQLCRVSSQPIAGEGAATLSARLERDGSAMIRVNDERAATADFFGPLLDTPADGLSVGFDGGKPVGDYAGEFAFRGEIASVDVTTVTNEPK